MTAMPRPILVVSRCLGFDACRWNGVSISSDAVRLLESYVHYMPVCPEVEIGLGIPRPPIRVVSRGSSLRLLQPETGRDCTAMMQSFAQTYLDGLGEVDGFVLKSRSPSCGIGDVRVYRGPKDELAIGKGSGVFASAVQMRWGHAAIEDEKHLADYASRHHFLTRVFASARYREQVLAQPSMANLIAFQSANKLLLLACSERQLRRMGKIVANHDKLPLEQVLGLYQQHLTLALEHPPRHTACINVLMHALGYFRSLLPAEKRSFLDTLQDYRTGRVPLSVPVAMVRSWIVRYHEPYLAQQTFFTPYPQELLETTDLSSASDG